MPAPPMTLETVMGLARVVTLSSEQSESVKSLHDGYRLQWARASERLKEFHEGLRDPTNGLSIEEQYSRDWLAFSRFSKHLDTLKRQLLLDLQQVLTEEQQPSWPRFERRLRRIEYCAATSCCAIGSNVDLVAIVEQVLGPTALSPVVDRLLESYEVAFDSARMRALEERERWQQQWVERQPPGPASFEDHDARGAVEAAIARTRPLQALHMDYLRRLGECTKPEAHSKIQNLFYSKASLSDCASISFSVVHPGPKLTPAEIIDAVQRLPNLREDQRRAVDEVADRYHKTAFELRRDRFEAIMRVERDPSAWDRWGKFESREVSGIEYEAVGVRWGTIQRLYDIVTKDQAVHLPVPLSLKGIEQPVFDDP